jgi:antitoxin component of MazEF toxin-antitoxin module
MSVRKQEEKNVRKITRVGKTSLAVTLPVEMIRDLGWREKQKVVVKRIKGGLEIRDWRRK